VVLNGCTDNLEEASTSGKPQAKCLLQFQQVNACIVYIHKVNITCIVDDKWSVAESGTFTDIYHIGGTH
jgi:hypothetical protein